MKAAILEKYASDGRELVVKDIPIPVIADDEVLVKVMAAAVNPLDNMIVRGEVKLIVSYRFPLVMGNELAGVVEKVGSKVNGFAKGDRVYARMPLDKIGAFSRSARIGSSTIARRTMPISSLTSITSSTPSVIRNSRKSLEFSETADRSCRSEVCRTAILPSAWGCRSSSVWRSASSARLTIS